jgi:phytoene dehydrogenase-like protein
VNAYDVGDLIRSSVTFTDFAGTPTDPTTVTFKYITPVGFVTQIVYPAGGITRDSAGVYHSDVTIAMAGSWWFRWNGTGAIIAATEEPVFVQTSMFP